jgi:hypothetical protein
MPPECCCKPLPFEPPLDLLVGGSNVDEEEEEVEAELTADSPGLFREKELVRLTPGMPGMFLMSVDSVL